MAYIKCPRCDLNYIQDTEQYCKVCLVDLGKIAATHIDDLDEDDLRLCSECNENYLEEGETLCYTCRLEHMKQATKESVVIDPDVMDFEEEFPIPQEDETEEILVDSIELLEFPEEEDAEESEENY